MPSMDTTARQARLRNRRLAYAAGLRQAKLSNVARTLGHALSSQCVLVVDGEEPVWLEMGIIERRQGDRRQS